MLPTAPMRAKPEIICGLMCVTALIALVRIVVHRAYYVESNNATLQANFAPLSPQVAGEVTHVFVNENQPVQKGQLLCTIEDRMYRAALDEMIEEKEALRAQLNSATRDAQRAAWLIRRNAISASARDQAFSDEHSLEEQVLAAEGRVQTARLNLEHTFVRAPADGMIAFRSASPGMYVNAGEPLFGFISDPDRWVEAKVKEVDLAGIKTGDSVEVRFDSMPGEKFRGHLENLGSASEAQFAAIPDDFAAGNFTKRVQWIPVRVRLELTPEERRKIPVGTSSVIEMKRTRS